MGRIAVIALPVHVTHHAVEQARVRSASLAHGNRRDVIEAIRDEVMDALDTERVLAFKPQGFAPPRPPRATDGDEPVVRYALSADRERCHVLKLVESYGRPAWLVVTTLSTSRRRKAAA